MKSTLILALLALCLIGCQAAIYRRTSFQIDQNELLIASNSPTVLNELSPVRLGDRLRFRYKVLLQNRSDKERVSVLLKDAKFEVRNLTLPTKCQGPEGKEGEYTLGPSQLIQVGCLVEIDSQAQAGLGKTDSSGVLSLPFRAAGQKQESFLKYSYVLRVEDFE